VDCGKVAAEGLQATSKNITIPTFPSDTNLFMLILLYTGDGFLASVYSYCSVKQQKMIVIKLTKSFYCERKLIQPVYCQLSCPVMATQDSASKAFSLHPHAGGSAATAGSGFRGVGLNSSGSR